MNRLLVESWLLLVYLDLLVLIRGFKSLYQAVRTTEIKHRALGSTCDRDISEAIDLACVFYVKPVMCLQRSAATAVLIRRHGRRAEMVIGMRLRPLKSHAWVEVNGVVVNDKPYVHELYQELDRC